MIIPVQIKRLPHYPKEWGLPAYGTEGAACFDLQSTTPEVIFISPGKSHIFGTGLEFAIPDHHMMQVFSRSGHGFKSSVTLANSVGIIDSDYRGEVKVKLRNDGDKPFTVSLGNKIAQAMVMPIQTVMFTEVDELPETARGKGGFGSTGR